MPFTTVGRTSEISIRELLETGNAHNRRVFTFGVGGDVNVPLLDRLADTTRAKSTYVLPGEDVEVKVEDSTLYLKGERKFEKEVKNDNYHRIERSYGTFARSFSLPNSINSDKVKAEFKDGLLTLTLPKREEAKPRTIKIDVSKN